MMLGLLRKMKRKIMVAEGFVMFFLVTLELNVGPYTIAVTRNRHAECISCREGEDGVGTGGRGR